MLKQRMNFFTSKSVFIKLILLVALLFVLSFIIQSIIVSSKDISKLDEARTIPTIIYDQERKIASKLTSSKIEWIFYESIPEYFIHALISTEDQSFYKHNGIDYFGILRATFRNMKAGSVVEGGSTLTQQLVKNSLLTQEKTYSRKLEEYFLAKKVEQEYSKEEILELYVNQIYFGEGSWGLKRAAEVYYGKNVSDLTLNESAILVGLIKAPTHYSPIKDKKKSFQRRDVVLSVMEKEKYINSSELKEAKMEELVLKGKSLDPYKGKFPHYVDYIIEEATQKYGLTQNEILSGGFEIYTELNPAMQEAVEGVYENDSLFPESPSAQLVQSGAVLLHPKTGGVQALVGGRGDHSFRQFNHATQLKRQPGSTMKPIAAYTPALEQSFGIYSEVKDEPLNLGGYEPKNYDGQYRGTVSMYDAFIHSYNVPAVWTLNEIGLKQGVDTVKRFGIPLTEKDENLGLSLGGLSEGVSPLEMAEAYSTFPNKGVRIEAHAITKIIDLEGNLEAEWEKKETEVTTEEVANKIIYMMLGVVNEGTGKLAKLADRELAAKTGSTQVPFAGIDGVKDQWVIGFTPELVGALWLGYETTDEKHYLKTSSGQTAAPLFKEIMEAAVKDTKTTKFFLPPFAKSAPKKEVPIKEEPKWKDKPGPDKKKEKPNEKPHEKGKPNDKGKDKGKGKD